MVQKLIYVCLVAKRNSENGIGVSGWRLYKWIKEQDYPDRYRVLCMNCNFSIGMWGYCPHNKMVD